MRKNLQILILLTLVVPLFLFADNDFAIGLDGGESFYVNDGNDALDVDSLWTVETWLKVGSYVSGNWECIIDRRTVFSFYLIDDTVEPVGDYAVHFVARDGTSIAASINSESDSLAFDTWYHFAITYDGTDAKIYVNNTLVDTDVDEDWLLTYSPNALNIGGRWWGSYSRQMSDAVIDEIRFSNIARDISEMQTNVNDAPYVVDSETILLMHLDDEGNPPTYVSGTDPVLSGSIGDDDITTDDYIDPGILTFGDQSAPEFANTYPRIQNETGTSVELAAQIDEDGTVYYVVLANDAVEPTSMEVKSGTGAGGVASIVNGNMNMFADQERTELIEGLSQNTEYDIFVVAEDLQFPPNLQNVPIKIDASTIIEDLVPPAYIDGFPSVDNITASSFEIEISIDENGTAYYVVLANDADEPTTSEVKNGTGSGGIIAISNGNMILTSNIVNSTVIESLQVSTDYDVYVVAEDDEIPPNLQDTVTKIDVNTSLNYRSMNSGNWFTRGNWERYNGTGWIEATDTPDADDNTIFIQSNHTIVLADTIVIDQMTIEADGQLTVTEFGHITINNGTDTDLSVWGIVRKESDGVIARLDSPEIEFLDGSKFELAGTNKYIIEANWDVNSTCEITGNFEGSMTSTYHTDQEFGNFIWNCPNQTGNVFFSGYLTSIKGDFQLIDTNDFEFRLTGTYGDDPAVYVEGNFELSGGILNMSSGENNLFLVCYNDFNQSGGEIMSTGTGSGNLRFGPMTGTDYTGTFTHTNGLFTPDDIQVRSSYELTLATNMNIDSADFTTYGSLVLNENNFIGTGSITIGEDTELNLTSNLDIDQTVFILEGVLDLGNFVVSGDSIFTTNATAVIKTANTLGLNGSIVMNDTVSFSSASDFVFNGTEAQVTGDLLPAEITDGLLIENPAGVTLTQNLTISGGNTGLELTLGNLIIPEGMTLTFDTDGGWSSASTESFIDGLVVKVRNSTNGFLFPIGKDDTYAPIQIFPQSTDETSFQAKYYDQSYVDITTCEDSLGNISNAEYWTLDRLSGLADAQVRLYWQHHIFGSQSDSLVVARWNDTIWVNEGQYEIDLENKWVTSEVSSDFSPFTFGEYLSEIPTIPTNVEIVITDVVFLDWAPVSGAAYYTVYSSNDPYAEVWDIEETDIEVSEWTGTLSEETRFYRVTASN